ncbi:hypothetical protein FDP41_009201 [Naegleria fowleri]|uniref:F5/8 type C domain-containing protein n=1 Tax=Naegleria fowleri TaxID=5763 RepID=A0A6A5BED4_NAEFO|nr:uncharacterized protein FDP41_009201 [Naegleria fowleri]KAF0972298.1 hypothetical protein FDP41_009201 [Naegleria fowleri]CAG4709758.1 unnamed protein product [Naegleria fowleri]
MHTQSRHLILTDLITQSTSKISLNVSHQNGCTVFSAFVFRQLHEYRSEPKSDPELDVYNNFFNPAMMAAWQIPNEILVISVGIKSIQLFRQNINSLQDLERRIQNILEKPLICVLKDPMTLQTNAPQLVPAICGLGCHVTASSSWSPTYSAANVALDHQQKVFDAGQFDVDTDKCWVAASGDTNPWLKVNFGELAFVHKIEIQGRKKFEHWVTQFELHASQDGVNWMVVPYSPQSTVFPGNTDKTTVVSHTLQNPVLARVLKIVPKTWHTEANMRCEVYITFPEKEYYHSTI